MALDRTAAAREIERITQYVPCSQAQLRFWFEEQLHPGNAGLNIAVRWQLEGELTDRVLAQAWRQLVARHAGLRTSFRSIDGEPVGVVEPWIDFKVRSVDLRGFDEHARSVEAERLGDDEALGTFNLGVAPLIRVTRLMLGARRSILLITAHHIICDGWSIGILAHEMGVICSALDAGREPALRELRIDYGDYAAWERECALQGSDAVDVAFAKQYLSDYTHFELLPDYPRPALQTSHGSITSLMLERELTDALATLARANGCTLFVVALSGLFALLGRYSNEADITLGTQIAGRDDADLEGIVGCFINTIALRGDISGDPSFCELLERTRDRVSAAFELRHFPLERLIEVMKPERDLSRNALFSFNFIFQRSFVKNATYGELTLVDLPSRSTGALYDLNIFMVERPEGWRLSCEYNTDLYRRATVEALLESFGRLMRSVVAAPLQRVSEIPILTAAQRYALVVEANQTQAAYPRDRTLPELFTSQVARSRGAIALTCGDASLTYAQLDDSSSRLARELTRRGIGRGMRVGVLLDRSPDLVVALLAVVKAGAAYVPLDPTFPVERLAHISGNAELAAIITRASSRDRVSGGTTCIDVDADYTAAEGERAVFNANGPAPDDVAYVIYTSGSTGLPKGVEVGHRQLVNLLWAMRERPGITSADTLVAVTTISFDIAALEVFLPLIVGATVVIAQEVDVIDGSALLALMQRTRATIVQATPVTWQLLIDAGWQGDPCVKMLCGGEALSRMLADQLLERGPDLWNMYGPTETTIWSSAVRVESGSLPVPIGPPIANTQFYVVDPAGNLAAPGVPGELYIGGDGVAFGYFKRPELTLERFVPDAFGGVPGAKLYRTGDIVRSRECGTFEFLGRTDHQVKIRGFRIELGEIEAALLRQRGVGAAVVVVTTDSSGFQSLCAYVVSQPSTLPDSARSANLRTALATFLPAYMLPNTIMLLDALPRTPNGKIDRRALPAPHAAAAPISLSSNDAPQTSTEIALAQLVIALVQRPQIGRTQDFFAVGFHSLLAVKLVAQIVQTFGVKLPLRAVFEDPTIVTLARRIDRTPNEAADARVPQPIVHLNAEGSRAPFVFFHNDLWSAGMYVRRIAAVTDPAQPLLAIAPHGTAGLAVLSTIEAMAADYLQRLREIQPAGPYRIGGFCAGGLVAYELARMLRARGEIVERLVLVNAPTPPRRAVLFGDALLRRVGLNSRLEVLLREKLCWNIVHFFDSMNYGPQATLGFLKNRLRALMNQRDEAGTAIDEPEPFEKRRETIETENYFANLVAAYTYHPRPYEGEVTLLWGTAQPTIHGDPTTGWGALAKSVRVLPMSGTHLSPLRAGVDELGLILEQVLRSGSL